MTIQSLEHTTFDSIITCFLESFKNYFVPLPQDKELYKKRWKSSKVDFKLSYGCFDQNKLVGFIIHAVDNRNGKHIAFNTGTGILPAYRGRKILNKLYAFALVDLKKNGIEHSQLEVITENEIAINAYKKVGFEIQKTYCCFSGEIAAPRPSEYNLKSIPLNAINWKTLPNQSYYSWDNQSVTVLRGNYTFYEVKKGRDMVAFFIIDPTTGYLPQLDVFEDHPENWNTLFSAISSIASPIKINNVDARLAAKVKALAAAGLKNTVNQFEMELPIT